MKNKINNTPSAIFQRNNPRPQIGILVADDSITVRKKVIEVLRTAPDIFIAGEAGNGEEAIALSEKLQPDVILMDLVMPVMSGLSAVKHIMVHRPTPIVILSSALNRGETYKTLDALKAGALVNVEKTDAEKDTSKWKYHLIQTVRAASRVHVIRRRQIPLPLQEHKKILPHPPAGRKAYNIIAIGASTGGPGIINNILKDFPPDFKVPVLVVMHIANTSSSTFAEWLNDNCRLSVGFASQGTRFNGNTYGVLIALPDQHLTVKHRQTQILDTAPVNYCKPSIDVLFHSLAADQGLNPIAVLLTGMGRDGADGLKAIKKTGGYTICQDEATCVIYGMPKAAVGIGAANIVLPDYKIAQKILALTHGH